VTSLTIKAHPNTPIAAQTLSLAPLTDSDIPSFMEALKIMYSAFPDLDDGGFSGYGSWSVSSFEPVVGDSTTGYLHALAVFNQSLEYAQNLFASTAAKLAPFNGTSLLISTSYFEFPDYYTYYFALSDNQMLVGSPAALTSRLLDRKALTGNPNALMEMLNSTAGLPGQFVTNSISLVSGGQVFADASEPFSGLNPAWRTSYIHNVAGRGWAPGSSKEVIEAVHMDITVNKTGALRKLAPNTGAYMNEADRLDPLYLEDFYGGALELLQGVKAEVDGQGLFYCPTCVGSEGWKEDTEGRLCRV
jgi:hypothetical protein